jgi:hypothetical protein
LLSLLQHNLYYSKATVHVVNVYQHVALHECPSVIVLDCNSIGGNAGVVALGAYSRLEFEGCIPANHA